MICMPKSIDYTGQKYYKLTCIKATNRRSSHGPIIWECLCDCGNHKLAIPSQIRNGTIKSCGCLTDSTKFKKQLCPKLDYSGTKIAMITFLKATDRRDHSGNIMWESLCDCGKIFSVAPGSVKRGHTKSCGCYCKYSPITASARRIWHSSYRECPFDLFLSLSQQNCFYCGCAPTRTYNVSTSCVKAGTRYQTENQIKNGNFVYNGLDRINSSLAHTIDNVVSCCYTCNIMKNTLGIIEFISHIEKIYHHTRNLSLPF